MKVAIWGCRGTLPAPGPATVRYGGNTSCVAIETAEGRLVVLDCGSGIRPLGNALAADPPRELDILLTHMHLDHVAGLGFFAPLFMDTTVRIWGPRLAGAPLAENVASYLSPPLFPIPFADIPARIEFTEVRDETWRIGDLSVTAAPVQHPGGALGYRLEEGGGTLAFIPDNELGLDPDAGVGLATGVDVLFHDAQYTEAEYPAKAGWGHSSLPDFASFVRRTEPGRALMFHHDPEHDEGTLEAMRDEATRLAGREVELAAEGLVVEVPGR
ncbi:MAG TPA: MBL fold metallo-hydrolase [Gaiellaceae bacterium]|nr:MBL fold metallo-hydrolase [Gaiellaceae bacterium]